MVTETTGRSGPEFLQQIHEAAKVIRQGGVVAFPTETYYGLGVDPFNPEALARLFTVKKRAPDKPVLTLVDRLEDLPLLVREIPEVFVPLMERYWPGPLTLVFEALPGLPALLTCDRQTVAIRISSSSIARALVRECHGPVTATSANLSGESPACTVGEVISQLGGSVDMIIDGGVTPGRMSSTLIGYHEAGIKLIREGAVSFSQIMHSIK